MGRERYQEKISHLKKVQPAYYAYEKGIKALERGDTHTAGLMAERALRMVPEESRFHCLLGDALSAQGDRTRAINAYERAVSKDPTYFRNYYQRGKLLAEMGSRQKAHRDFEKSLKLLPTADGHYALGQLTLADGNQREAVKLFKKGCRLEIGGWKSSSSRTAPL